MACQNSIMETDSWSCEKAKHGRLLLSALTWWRCWRPSEVLCCYVLAISVLYGYGNVWVYVCACLSVHKKLYPEPHCSSSVKYVHWAAEQWDGVDSFFSNLSHSKPIFINGSCIYVIRYMLSTFLTWTWTTALPSKHRPPFYLCGFNTKIARWPNGKINISSQFDGEFVFCRPDSWQNLQIYCTNLSGTKKSTIVEKQWSVQDTNQILLFII